MNIDRRRLRRDLAELAKAAHALKRTLRTTWTRPMADEQRKLAGLRRRTTELCVPSAHLRGRLHVREDAEWHARVAARVAKDYEVAS